MTPDLYTIIADQKRQLERWMRLGEAAGKLIDDLRYELLTKDRENQVLRDMVRERDQHQVTALQAKIEALEKALEERDIIIGDLRVQISNS